MTEKSGEIDECNRGLEKSKRRKIRKKAERKVVELALKTKTYKN
jgi:hypothetical protein